MVQSTFYLLDRLFVWRGKYPPRRDWAQHIWLKFYIHDRCTWIISNFPAPSETQDHWLKSFKKAQIYFSLYILKKIIASSWQIILFNKQSTRLKSRKEGLWPWNLLGVNCLMHNWHTSYPYAHTPTHTIVNTKHARTHTSLSTQAENKTMIAWMSTNKHLHPQLSTVPQTKTAVQPCASAPGGDLILHPPLNPHMNAHKHTDINPPPCLTAYFEEQQTGQQTEVGVGQKGPSVVTRAL